MVFLVAVAVAWTAGESRVSGPIVETTLGKVRGSILKTWTGKPILAFRGLRYAKAPIGRLRFKPPMPLERWSGIKDVTEDGPVCHQPGASFFGPPSEDCLYVNVYSRELRSSKPVIVFFHPGGFYAFSSRSDWAGPDYLLYKDIVLVTVNYRLGPLGFLSTGDKEAVGNYGMKDQVAALRWVKNNIARFGGNPESVTITGYSAGSTSVMLHILSPMSQGLFHKGIAMSAGVTSNWVVNEDPLALAKRVGELFSCPTTGSTKQLVDCLRNVPADELSEKTFAKMGERGSDPKLYLTMVVEPDTGDGSQRFLIGHPRNLIRAKKFSNVPLVIGITKNEFDVSAERSLQNETWLNEVNNHFEKVAPIELFYEIGTEKSKEFSRKIRRFYLGEEPITKDNKEFGKIFSDAIIIFGQVESAKLFAQYSRSPVYFYMTTYMGRFSYIVDEETKKPLGVAHHDEMLYLFHNAKNFPEKFNTTDPEAKAVDRFTSFWSNFAHNGDPTPTGESTRWTPMRFENLQYLEIGNELSMKNGLPYPERMAVWEEGYPTPSTA